MGFHKAVITKGVYGEVSKVREEVAEALDAHTQGQYLMLLIELSDIVGALGGVGARFGWNLSGLLSHDASRDVPDSWADNVPTEIRLRYLRDHLDTLEDAVAANHGDLVLAAIQDLFWLATSIAWAVQADAAKPSALVAFAELRSQVAREEEGTT